MCGIIGILSLKTSVCENLVEALKRLEYRGYDSSGVAVLSEDNQTIERVRAEGKIVNLVEKLSHNSLKGRLGIGHTRWATHGEVCEDNAHPMANECLALVHNGIIENFADLKKIYVEKGYVFTSHTDTEVILHIIDDFLKQNYSPKEAISETIALLKGTFALAIIFKAFPHQIFAAKKGSPLVVGKVEDVWYVASDAIALGAWTQEVIYLEDGDLVALTLSTDSYDMEILNNNAKVERPIKMISTFQHHMGKGEFPHYMLKEIHEQPETVSETLKALINLDDLCFSETLSRILVDSIERIQIIACGTSFYAGLTAKYWLESIAGIPTDVEIASEFRYRDTLTNQKTLHIFISQSGETIDTLSCLEKVKNEGSPVLSIVNVPESVIARKSDYFIQTLAGPEIGVASTKAFTGQLTVLAVLCLYIARSKNAISQNELRLHVRELTALPQLMHDVLGKSGDLYHLASLFVPANTVLYLGRGESYPIALEGALKLKELTYIHAEGYPAGELKHGPIALIDTKVPVVVIAPLDRWFEKTLSNMQEVYTRGAKVLLITSEEGEKIARSQVHVRPGFEDRFQVLSLPVCKTMASSILYTVPVQLLAYHTAYLKGTDVDQPRNLAKSVTVE
ncbi:MAG: glutamine--fructose-6-phosphate transaminase (isomerizing) [Candidatus Puniceispirillum sp.]|nr:glutamine--fructose-6-phosphate transaminase (isomerizing) [Candidatus Pelagibacter sp.]MBA4283539.1 glutamine--fructose-6-phosphate transaminase (isomerizing) [Candidatus Puniceispirillum sp.]